MTDGNQLHLFLPPFEVFPRDRVKISLGCFMLLVAERCVRAEGGHRQTLLQPSGPTEHLLVVVIQ